jgi:uncharacterized membrane protein
MWLTYETGIGTLIQFIALSLLNLATGANSVVTTCRHDGGDCVSNLIVSMIFYILVVGWFAFVSVLGYAAQDRRSKRLAQVLIIAEFCIAGLAFFNIKHRNGNDWLSLVTSLIDLVLAIWIITLAWRLMRADGGRVVSTQRTRRRPAPRSKS